MAEQVRDLLERRGDLSTFVVHLTRDKDATTAEDRLLSIIQQQQLSASSPFGWATAQDNPATPAEQTQRCVCFTETPLEHIYMQLKDIQGRTVQMRPYGLAFAKMQARRLRINPILYVDQTKPLHGYQPWELSQALNDLRDLAIASGFHQHPAAKILPFCEPMGTYSSTSQREFWWEREWRHRGNLQFALTDVALWLCPEDRMPTVGAALQGAGMPPDQIHLLDPAWGLEHMIAHLVGRAGDITPFAP